MTIVNPLASSHVVVQSTIATGRPEERQNELRPEQVIRATVVEGGLDRAVLDMNHQRFRVQVDHELLAGQQLELKVLTTRPQLTFKLLSAPIESRLAALFPLLAKSFDWSGLVQQIQSGPTPQPEAMRQVLRQLSTLLKGPAELPTRDLVAMAAGLRRLQNAAPLFTGATGPALKEALGQVLTALTPHTEVHEPFLQLQAIAQQIRQEPELARATLERGGAQLAKLLTNIEQPVQPVGFEQAKQLAAEMKSLLTGHPVMLGQMQGKTSAALAALLGGPGLADVEVTPKLLGQLKDFVAHLAAAIDEKLDWSPELRQQAQQIAQVVTPLVAGPEILVQSSQLGLLAQLFGLNLETELLRGKTREALSSLKLALLGERAKTEGAGSEEEALHRLELFQVCRVRLAEQHLTFVPLPLPFLEEGYLLAEEDRHSGQKADSAERTRRLSLHLRLSALGNLRIDMLTEDSGMLLRIACEDQSRADFLKAMSDQLRGQLQAVSVSSLSFTTGADSPARELMKMILPGAHGMLDARV